MALGDGQLVSLLGLQHQTNDGRVLNTSYVSVLPGMDGWGVWTQRDRTLPWRLEFISRKYLLLPHVNSLSLSSSFQILGKNTFANCQGE